MAHELAESMNFVVDIPRLRDPHPDEVARRWRRYCEYIHAARDRLPPRAFAYATSEWHSDYSHRMSPHDGWVNSVQVEESATGARSEERSIRIVIELLASYHDANIRFTYPKVKRYMAETPSRFEWPPYGVGHGDWLADEVRLSEDGFVVHEILFSRGATWLIEADEIEYEWIPLETTTAE